MNKRWVVLFFRCIAAAASIAITTVIVLQFKSWLDIQLITLLFLLPVLLSTVRWGLIPGILAGFLAFLTFNYFFIPPYHTFLVHKTQDLISLLVFLVVSIVTSQLIGQAREGMRIARSREWEATKMYELISSLSGLQDNQSIARVLAAHIFDTFQCQYVEVEIGGGVGEPGLIVRMPEQDTQPEARLLKLPLQTARSLEGEIRLRRQIDLLTSEENRLIKACVSQGALAVERVRLAKSENKARIFEESDQMKTSLLNSVSHELRSPLAAIKASVSSLRSGAVDWDHSTRHELLETIEEETDHLNLLVGNLLDMSRIESGALKPHQRWNSIGEIAMSAVHKRHKQLQNHTLVMSFPDDLPLVPTDYVMLEQVFINLLSNSAKYAPPGTEISLESYQEGDSLHTRISNRGPAVPDEHLEKIFEKFHRVTEADRVTGTGLGLSICKGIIEAHGGKVWAANEPGCFAFHFLIPLSLNGVFPEVPKEASDG